MPCAHRDFKENASVSISSLRQEIAAYTHRSAAADFFYSAPCRSVNDDAYRDHPQRHASTECTGEVRPLPSVADRTPDLRHVGLVTDSNRWPEIK
ncbi:unnamed protein product [Nippostrongylus brasiliensis]|uniref:Uncharacterized protein n=1 Tax=Nippostrongylus brasiliensis TaxID=27835 RepID=A0A0N4Y1I6_NIPBR|nr:unnamed protein product [Nippostrongylus brasiliensis]